MIIPELIRKKRNNGKFTREEIGFIIHGYVAGSVTDYQMAALLMAIHFQKMDFEETSYLTEFLLQSGLTLDLSDIPGVKVDKHSTGGVGDKVSIILAPMVAACGVTVPMISGRGLGHTGGTLDKLEAIPGFRIELSAHDIKKNLSNIGVIIGQTDEIAPVDTKLYALRDVTATVESIPLIASSIMSKKLAEGIDALILDIKIGKGAVMQTQREAEELADMFIGIGKNFSKKILCFLTDMDQPLGYAVGNWLEILECVDCLKGKDVPDLMEVTYALGGAMVMLGGKAKTIDDGIKICRTAIEDGSAWNKFLGMVEAQGGDIAAINNPTSYPKSRFVKEIRSPEPGWVQSMDALEIGFAANMLGVGRLTTDDKIDPKAGVLFRKKISDSVEKNEIIAICFSDFEEKINAGSARIANAIQISAKQTIAPERIHALIDEKGIQPWKK
ncbi:MAG: thymidine phosphorylase [Bacteroidota bacterium]